MKNRRKLTPFLAQEMLYDFVTNELDAERRAAVQEYVDNESEGQRLQSHITTGLRYAKLLAQTQLSNETVLQLKDAENVVSLSRKYSSWRAWPEAIRWSVIAILVSTTVAGTVAIIPWPSVLGLFGKSSPPATQPQVAQTLAANDTTQLQEDKEPEEGDVAANGKVEADETSNDDIADQGEQVTSAVDAKAIAKAAAKPDAAATTKNAIAAVGIAADAKKPISSAPTNVDASDQEASSETEGDHRAGKPKGFVYRANMQLANLEDVGPKIAQTIKDLGGEKAGEVELGWKRGAGRYYHFSLPEMNEKKLMDTLQAYGPVRISKDPHPRVMPNGQVRFILWIESAN